MVARALTVSSDVGRRLSKVAIKRSIAGSGCNKLRGDCVFVCMLLHSGCSAVAAKGFRITLNGETTDTATNCTWRPGAPDGYAPKGCEAGWMGFFPFLGFPFMIFVIPRSVHCGRINKCSVLWSVVWCSSHIIERGDV